MIDRELLGKIRDTMDVDEETDGKTEEQRKKEEQLRKEQGCLTALFYGPIIIAALFFILIGLSGGFSGPALSDREKLVGEGRTHTTGGLLVEKDADISGNIDSDRIIDLSVRQIQSKGHSCNSLTGIRVYSFGIYVDCDESQNRYILEQLPTGLWQVTRK